MSTLNLIDINGQIDTSKTCLENLNTIATNSQSFLSWDPEIGKWTAKLNRPVANTATASVADFNDDNIVGAITVSGSGITDKYNSIKVTYNADDLEGDKDEIILDIDPDDRYSNELDNDLSINYSLINKSPIAERLGVIELNQSRVDKIIEFATDYTFLNIKPGELIRVTNEQYNYINKVFRVATVEEIDTEDGAILIGITALEYFSSVYDAVGIIREQRDKITGIIPKESNVCVYNKETEQASNDAQDAEIALTGLTQVALLRSGSLNYDDKIAPQSETDADFFFDAGLTEFDPTDTTYLIDTALDYTVRRSGFYAINWSIYDGYLFAGDGGGGLALPNSWRRRVGFQYKLNGNPVSKSSDIYQGGIIPSALSSIFDTVNTRLEEGDTLDLLINMKNDLKDRTQTGSSTQQFIFATFSIYYYGDA